MAQTSDWSWRPFIVGLFVGPLLILLIGVTVSFFYKPGIL